MSKRALCLINPKAKAGDAALDAVAARLTEAGIDLRVERPDSQESAAGLIREASDDIDLIIVGGGDGTVSHMLGALMQAGKPVGILPLGTANDLVRSLGLPLDPVQAAGVIALGPTRAIDVGFVNDRPFLNVASVGFSADVARFHRGPRKRWLGVFAYPLSWWDAWRAARPFRARLTVDGESRRVSCVQLAIGSGRHYGGGMTIDEKASHSDGLLRIYYVKPVGLADWLGLLPALRFGWLRKERNAVVLDGREVEIKTSRRKRIDVDGDLVERTPAKFRIAPGALTVFAPAEGPEARLAAEGAAARPEAAPRAPAPKQAQGSAPGPSPGQATSALEAPPGREKGHEIPA